MNLENLVRGHILAIVCSHQKRYNDLIKHMSNGNDENFRYFRACENGCAKVHWLIQHIAFPFPESEACLAEIADWYCVLITEYSKCDKNFDCFGNYAVVASSAASRLCDEIDLALGWLFE